MLKNSTTQIYYVLKVDKFPISLKMMRLTRTHWLHETRMINVVLIKSPVGKLVIHNRNLVMMMLFLRIKSIFLTQEVMVDVS